MLLYHSVARLEFLIKLFKKSTLVPVHHEASALMKFIYVLVKSDSLPLLVLDQTSEWLAYLSVESKQKN